MNNLFMMGGFYSVGLALCVFYKLITDDIDSDADFFIPYSIGIVISILMFYFTGGG